MLESLVIILVIVFLAVDAFFSGSETAIISASRAKLRLAGSRNNPRAKLALRLLGKSEELLATILVGTNIAVVSSVTLATWLIARWIPPQWDKSLVATLLMTPLILVFAELIPKCICRARADSITLHAARPLLLAQRLLYVIIASASRITRMLLCLTRRQPSAGDVDVSREELKALAQIGEEQGMLAPQTRRMIQRVFDLSDRLVVTVMVPFSAMVSLPLEATVEQVEHLAGRTGYSRFPVYQGRRDNIVGILNLTDILYGSLARSSSIEPFVRRQVSRVPRNKSLAGLLTEFRYSQIPLAIVVDQTGRALGSLSPQDLLEEIVGTIRGERPISQ